MLALLFTLFWFIVAVIVVFKLFCFILGFVTSVVVTLLLMLLVFLFIVL